MDWSKAKTLLIVALLVTDLVLGGFLLHGKTVQRQNERKAAENIGNYLVDLGAELNCGLADDSRMLPVLFISFPEGSDTSEYSEEAELYSKAFPPFSPGSAIAANEQLLHRWSFNGSLSDTGSVGGKDAALTSHVSSTSAKFNCFCSMSL